MPHFSFCLFPDKARKCIEMSVDEYNEMMNELDMLLNGGITYKNINGKKYAYYQWREIR